MRILNISAQKPDSTGSGIYLSSLVSSFARAGHEAGVIAGVAADEPCEIAGASWTRPVRFDTDELPFPVVGMSDEMPYRSTRYCDLTPQQVRCFERAFVQALEDALSSFNPDVVLCHHLYLLCAIVRERVHHVPVCAISHSTDLRQMHLHSLEHDRIVAAVRGLDEVFALHTTQASEIADCYGVNSSRIQIIGTGYDANVFNFGHTRRVLPCPSTSSDPLELVYAGKICRKKGVESLIAAVDQLDYPRESVHGVLAGGFGDAQEYSELCAAAQECRYPLQLVGRLSQEQLANYYRNADVFVLPSFYEGLPLVVLEALACGCRVVVTDLPGIRPWLSTYAPDAPIVFVKPPHMEGPDDPLPSDLPAFEHQLAIAIKQSLSLPRANGNLEELSWDSLAARVISLLQLLS